MTVVLDSQSVPTAPMVARAVGYVGRTSSSASRTQIQQRPRYDDEGNRIQQTEVEGDEVVERDWDYRTRFTCVATYKTADMMRVGKSDRRLQSASNDRFDVSTAAPPGVLL